MNLGNGSSPVDVIVQDWQWWGKYGWNAMQFDENKYPDPGKMVRELHNMNIHLMLSVWSKIDKQSALGKQMESKKVFTFPAQIGLIFSILMQQLFIGIILAVNY